MIGTKNDARKPRMSLMPEDVLREMLAVLEFGAAKYGEDNWKYVPNGTVRYYDAAMRHLDAWWHCDPHDSESGKSHLAHVMCCVAFLMWLDKEDVHQCDVSPDQAELFHPLSSTS